MSDLEPPRDEQPPELSPPTRSDPWQIWFSRAVQVAGLGMVIFEGRPGADQRPWLLLLAAGMMMGGLGLQLIVRWGLARLPQ